MIPGELRAAPLLPVTHRPTPPIEIGISSLLAVDPGNVQSGWVILRAGRLEQMGIAPNEELREKLDDIEADHMAIEFVDYFGMAVGHTVFDTAWWAGRFAERWGRPYTRAYRKRVGYHFCNSPRANDKSIRRALIDRFGAKGTQKAPGFLYGVHDDIWAAVAVAVYYVDCATAGESMER